MAQNRPRPSSSDCATIVKRGYLHDKRTGILLVSSLLPRELCVVQWGDMFHILSLLAPVFHTSNALISFSAFLAEQPHHILLVACFCSYPCVSMPAQNSLCCPRGAHYNSKCNFVFTCEIPRLLRMQY